jgi:hypothetical protein
MDQSPLNFNADEDDQDAEPGATAMPGSVGERDSSSIQSPNFQLAAASNPVGDAAHSAEATRTDASSGGNTSTDAQPNPSVQSDPAQNSQSARTQQQPSVATSDSGDALAQPTAFGAAPAPRQRQPVKQIGQIPIIDDAWMHETFTGPAPETAAQAQEQHAVWMQMAQQSLPQWQQIAQINESDPYISDDDGRWKKQTADPITGAIHETDILDAGSGKIDRSTGNIHVQTAQGPQVIGVDPQQKQLTQIVDQKAQAQEQGSPIDANIAAAKSGLLDTQRQLQTFQGIPERMSARIGKYTQASLDPNNTAAADQLQRAQTAFNDWKQQNPRYTELSAKRDALANQFSVAKCAIGSCVFCWVAASQSFGSRGDVADGGMESDSIVVLDEVADQATRVAFQRIRMMKVDDAPSFPILQPMIARDERVVLVGLAVALLPVVIFGAGEPDPGDQLQGADRGARRPALNEIDDHVADVVGDPTGRQISPSSLFKRICSAMISAMTSSFSLSLDSRRSIFFNSLEPWERGRRLSKAAAPFSKKAFCHW